MNKVLAIVGVDDDIAAVRHDLPHMPSLGVSSLDSRPPWRHGGLLFCRLLSRQGHGRTGQLAGGSSIPTKSRSLFAPAILYELLRQTNGAAADPLLPHQVSLSADALAETVILRVIPDDERMWVSRLPLSLLWSMRCAIANSNETPRRCC